MSNKKSQLKLFGIIVVLSFLTFISIEDVYAIDNARHIIKNSVNEIIELFNIEISEEEKNSIQQSCLDSLYLEESIDIMYADKFVDLYSESFSECFLGNLENRELIKSNSAIFNLTTKNQ